MLPTTPCVQRRTPLARSSSAHPSQRGCNRNCIHTTSIGRPCRSFVYLSQCVHRQTRQVWTTIAEQLHSWCSHALPAVDAACVRSRDVLAGSPRRVDGIGPGTRHRVACPPPRMAPGARITGPTARTTQRRAAKYQLMPHMPMAQWLQTGTAAPFDKRGSEA